MTKQLSMKGWAIILVALMAMVFATTLLGSAGIERAHAEDAPVESPEEQRMLKLRPTRPRLRSSVRMVATSTSDSRASASAYPPYRSTKTHT